jgi:type IV pilus assembly protein PilA
MLKINRNSKGFTLIELLIVIAIIGILAAIAIPAYSGYTKKSKMGGVVSAMGAVKNAVYAYYTEAGSLGTGASALAAVGTTYGVTPPTQYISDAAVSSAGVITLTITNIGTDVNGTTLTLTPGAGFQTWTWGGTVPVAYMPKSN